MFAPKRCSACRACQRRARAASSPLGTSPLLQMEGVPGVSILTPKNTLGIVRVKNS